MIASTLVLALIATRATALPIPPQLSQSTWDLGVTMTPTTAATVESPTSTMVSIYTAPNVPTSAPSSAILHIEQSGEQGSADGDLPNHNYDDTTRRLDQPAGDDAATDESQPESTTTSDNESNIYHVTYSSEDCWAPCVRTLRTGLSIPLLYGEQGDYGHDKYNSGKKAPTHPSGGYSDDEPDSSRPSGPYDDSTRPQNPPDEDDNHDHISPRPGYEADQPQDEKTPEDVVPEEGPNPNHPSHSDEDYGQYPSDTAEGL